MTRGNAYVASALAIVVGVGSLPVRADTYEAIAAYKAGRYLEAVAEIQAVVDQSPGYAYGYFLLGHCMLKMRRVGEAEVQFQRAVRLDPARADYYHGLASAFKASGNWPLMIHAANDGLLRTQDPRTRYALLKLRSYAAGALRRWNDAVRDLEAAQRIRSEPWLLVFLGTARFATGAYASAVVPLRQLLLVEPDDPDALRLLAECFLRLAADEQDPVRKRFDYSQALIYARRLASVTPDDLDAVHLVGRAALGAGQLDQAESVFRHVLVKNPRHCYAMADLGRAYMASARWTEAEAYLQRASACAPRMTAVFESLGEVYLELGKPQEAAAMFRRVEEIEPRPYGTDLPAAVPIFQPR